MQDLTWIQSQKNHNCEAQDLTWIRSNAVSLVWRRDETNIRTGLVGEWVHIAAYAGLFMLFILGQ